MCQQYHTMPQSIGCRLDVSSQMKEAAPQAAASTSSKQRLRHTHSLGITTCKGTIISRKTYVCILLLGFRCQTAPMMHGLHINRNSCTCNTLHALHGMQRMGLEQSSCSLCMDHTSLTSLRIACGASTLSRSRSYIMHAHSLAAQQLCKKALLQAAVGRHSFQTQRAALTPTSKKMRPAQQRNRVRVPHAAAAQAASCQITPTTEYRTLLPI